jgi:hypothetical protein
MSPISAGEFQEWKSHVVTKAFMHAAQERIYDCVMAMSTQAGMDTVQDNFMRGFVAAYRELESFRIDDLVEDVE